MAVTRRGFLKRALAAIGALVVGRPVVEGYLKAEREWYLPPEPAAQETEYFFKGGEDDQAAPSLWNESDSYFVSSFEWDPPLALSTPSGLLRGPPYDTGQ